MYQVRTKIIPHNRKDRGFSMIELLVAIAVVSLVFIAIISAVTYSLRNSRYSKEKAVSVRLATETIEWSRRLRSEFGWGYLYDVLEADDSNTNNVVDYCLTLLPETKNELVALSQLSDITNCPPITLDSVNFTRYVQFTLDDSIPESRAVRVVSYVEWDGGEYETKLETTLREWK